MTKINPISSSVNKEIYMFKKIQSEFGDVIVNTDKIIAFEQQSSTGQWYVHIEWSGKEPRSYTVSQKTVYELTGLA